MPTTPHQQQQERPQEGAPNEAQKVPDWFPQSVRDAIESGLCRTFTSEEAQAHAAEGAPKVADIWDRINEMRPKDPDAPTEELFDGPPVLFDEAQTPEIPASLLPGSLGAFAGALATSTETPEALAVMAALGAVSAAVTGRLVVSPVDGWREPANIYTLIALPPGNNKSLVLNACAGPIVGWEQEQVAKVKPEIEHLKSVRKSEERVIEGFRAKLIKAKDPLDREALIREIATMESQLPEIPALPQVFANDATPESLAQSVYEQGGCFSIISDEGGITETVSGLYTGGSANVDILLKGIDGGHLRVRRRERQYDVNPHLTVLLAVQPKILLNMGQKRAFSGNGLMERFLFVLPKSHLGQRKFDKPPVPDHLRNGYGRQLQSLLNRFAAQSSRRTARTCSL
jgi:hypothetical protein